MRERSELRKARETDRLTRIAASEAVPRAAHPALDWQRTVGNHAVQRLLRSGPHGAERLRRQPATAVRPPQQISEYDYTGKEQEKTAKPLTSAHVRIVYDPEAGLLDCTFPIKWRFPPNWSAKGREDYIKEFEAVVSAAWSGRYTLEEVAGKKPTGRTAQVRVRFDHVNVPDFASGTEYIRWLAQQGPDVAQRWTLQVSPKEIRDEVRAPVVDLDPGSLQEEEADAGRYKEETFSGSGETVENPPYYHYQEAGVPLKTDKGPFKQRPAVHEFGHMIGLADEYILSKEDYEGLRARLNDDKKARRELARRSRATPRIMNIGDRIEPDHYRPFVEWLSAQTGTEWRVGRAVPAQKPAKR